MAHGSDGLGHSMLDDVTGTGDGEDAETRMREHAVSQACAPLAPGLGAAAPLVPLPRPAAATSWT